MRCSSLTSSPRCGTSFEDDAIIAHSATGRYIDPNRVHTIDYRGPSFSVTGPLTVPALRRDVR